MFGTGPETFPEVRNWSGEPPGGPEVVEGPLGGREVFRRPFQRSGSSR